MSDEWDCGDLTFYRYEEPPTPPAGVTQGWLVVWSGKPGPAHLLKLAKLVDSDGRSTMVVDGEWFEGSVYDDREDQP